MRFNFITIVTLLWPSQTLQLPCKIGKKNRWINSFLSTWDDRRIKKLLCVVSEKKIQPKSNACHPGVVVTWNATKKKSTEKQRKIHKKFRLNILADLSLRYDCGEQKKLSENSRKMTKFEAQMIYRKSDAIFARAKKVSNFLFVRVLCIDDSQWELIRYQQQQQQSCRRAYTAATNKRVRLCAQTFWKIPRICLMCLSLSYANRLWSLGRSWNDHDCKANEKKIALW